MKTEINSLLKTLKRKLVNKNFTISTAESCTGGLLAGYFTSLPGSSSYFLMGVVTYSYKSKMELLKIPEEVLKQYGAVSPQVAKHMVRNLQNLSKSNIAISITGIAGPDGATDEKPVGTVCFGLYTNSGVTSFTYYFNGTRSEIRKLACKQALQIILDSF